MHFFFYYDMMLAVVSVHIMILIGNRPVDTGNIQGSRRPVFFVRIK